MSLTRGAIVLVIVCLVALGLRWLSVRSGETAVPSSVASDAAAPVDAATLDERDGTPDADNEPMSAPTPRLPERRPSLENVVVAPFVVAERIDESAATGAVEVPRLFFCGDGGGCDAGVAGPVVLVGYATRDLRVQVARLVFAGRRPPEVSVVPVAFADADVPLATPPAAGTVRTIARVAPVSFADTNGVTARVVVDVRERTVDGWRARCGASDEEPIVRLAGGPDSGIVAGARCSSAPGLAVWEEHAMEDDAGVLKQRLMVTTRKSRDDAGVREVRNVPQARGAFRLVDGPDALVRGNVVHLHREAPSEDTAFVFPSVLTGGAWIFDYFVVSRSASTDIEALGPREGKRDAELMKSTLDITPSFPGCAHRTRTLLAAGGEDNVSGLLAIRETCDTDERILLYRATRLLKFSSFDVDPNPIEVALEHPVTALTIAMVDLGDWRPGILLVYSTKTGKETSLRALVLDGKVR